jgi:hypothetical protein
VVTAAIYAAVIGLAANERRRAAFKAVSPGLLPPLGIVFGLVVGFLVAQVWSDSSQAQQAVNREASALRTVDLLVDRFPGAPEARMHALVRRHIEIAVSKEWPDMANQRASLTIVSTSLGAALQLALALQTTNDGQAVAQKEIVSSLENALDARRQRIIVSESRVNWVKWTGVILLAAIALVAIAFVHVENRITAALAMGVFAAAVAVVLVMIAV